MNRKLNKPIIQAGVVILVCIVLISFGLASGSNGFFGNLKILFSALFSTITFIIGISVAIFLSIVILIGLFLGATAIYSPEKARNLFKKLWSSTQDFAEIVKVFFLKKVEDIEHSEKLHDQKEYLVKQVKELSSKLSHLSEKVTSSSMVTGDHDRIKGQSGREKYQELMDLNTKIETLSSEMADLRHEFQKLQETVQHQLSGLTQSPNQPVDDLPPPLHILRYLDSDEEKERLTEYVNETVRQKLSFAMSREYLLKELPDHLRALIEEHPRLTKDFIRHQRNELSEPQ